MEVWLTMSNQTLNARMVQRNDTAANWTTTNPVLLKGEMGVEIDTAKVKFGDGVSTWTALGYSGVMVVASGTNGHITIDGVDTTVYTLPVGGAAIGGVKSGTGTGIVSIDAEGNMTITKVSSATLADAATKLATARTISLSGDISGSVSFDGTAAAAIVTTLPNLGGLSAGTYTKLTVNTKGQVTAGATLLAADIPTLTLSKISDAGTAASKNIGTGSGNIPVLDANGKLADSVIPALAIGDVFEVASQAAMLALTAQVGDIAVRSDENKTYMLKASPASTLANWILLRTPTDVVLSVNGKTGAVTLATTDITEGTNLYFTTARATANFNTNFAAKSVRGLSDGAEVCLTTDTFVINCGNA
jgi:hypothetical protein